MIYLFNNFLSERFAETIRAQENLDDSTYKQVLDLLLKEHINKGTDATGKNKVLTRM